MRVWTVLSAVAIAVGCGDGAPADELDSATPPPSETSATAVPTGETGTEPDPGPVSISATCDPTVNPLRFLCHVSVSPPQGVQVTFSPVDGARTIRNHASVLAVGEHDVPLYFMHAEEEYAWTATTVAAPGDASVSGVFTTGELDSAVESELTVVGESSVPYIGVNDPCDTQAVGVVYDTTDGQIVWYAAVGATGTFGFLNMIQYTEDHTVLGETGAAVVEVDLAGNELYRLEDNDDYDANLHHDVFKKDGLYYLLFNEGSSPQLDGLLVYDAAGTQVVEWRARTSLDIPSDANGDWMHTNTVVVDDAGDIYLSSFEQNSIIKIDGDFSSPDFGSLVWALAGDQPAGFGQDFTVDWSAVSDNNFGNQHDIKLTDDGRLVMLDNPRGRALVFELDQVNLAATAVGEYPTEQTSCGPQGTAAVSSSGNVFAGCSGSVVREYAPGGAPVWEGEVECGGGFESAVRFYPLEGW